MIPCTPRGRSGPSTTSPRQAGAGLRERLDAGAPPRAIFSAVLDELRRRPPVVAVLEDLHWADAATLDLVKFLGRRIEQTPALLVLTYRDDELDPRHPLRIVLGDLATSRALRRIPLPPLSIAAVRTLAAGRALDATALHRQTGGNPFFVTEALARREAGIPPTVRDAVLARAARLSPSGRAALEAAAIIGAQVEPWLLTALVGDAAAAAEECIALGMLRAQGDLLAFRHELARQAILDTIAPPRRRALHVLALRALAAPPAGAPDLARLAHHAEGAGDARRASWPMRPPPPRAAAALGAHREAADQYARALRFAARRAARGAGAAPGSLRGECMLVDRLDEAIRARREAIDVHHAAGDRLREGKALAVNAAALVHAGRNPEAEEASRRAIAVLRALPPGPALAYAYRIQANLRMLNRDRAEAVRWGRKAIALAERFGEREIVVAALQHPRRGHAGLRRRPRARAPREEPRPGPRGGPARVDRERLRQPRLGLRRGVPVRGCRPLPDRGHPLRRRARSRLRPALHAGVAGADPAVPGPLGGGGRGRASARREPARGGHQPDHGAGGPRASAHAPGRPGRGRGARRGARAGRAHADAPAPRAGARGAGGGRVAGGRRPRALAEARAAWDLALHHRHAWHTGELGFWRWRAGERVRLPACAARPFARQIAGDWRRAAAAWERLGCPYERARALADGDDAAQLAALEIFDRLGARPDLERLRQRLRAGGVRHIPRGPRLSTRGNPFGLTAREAEIAALLARGLTNARIGARLHISPKTVDHHVSAILGKLGVASREEAGRLAITARA